MGSTPLSCDEEAGHGGRYTIFRPDFIDDLIPRSGPHWPRIIAIMRGAFASAWRERVAIAVE